MPQTVLSTRIGLRSSLREATIRQTQVNVVLEIQIHILFLLFQTTIIGNKEKTDMNTVETKRWVDLLWIHNTVNMNVQM